LDRLDAERLEVADDPLVVDDLAEGMRRLAGWRGFLGLVDGLADAIADPGALRDANVLDGSHVASIIAWAPFEPPRSAGRRRGRADGVDLGRGVDALLRGRHESGD